MVSALDSRSSGPGSIPRQEYCVVFLDKTQLSQRLSPPRCINGYRQINAKGNSAMDWHSFQGGVAIFLFA